MSLTKTDIKRLKKMMEKVVVNDLELEELAGELGDKANDYYEKDTKASIEKAEVYAEISDALVEFTEAYQTLYSVLEEYEVMEG